MYTISFEITDETERKVVNAFIKDSKYRLSTEIKKLLEITDRKAFQEEDLYNAIQTYNALDVISRYIN